MANPGRICVTMLLLMALVKPLLLAMSFKSGRATLTSAPQVALLASTNQNLIGLIVVAAAASGIAAYSGQQVMTRRGTATETRPADPDYWWPA